MSAPESHAAKRYTYRVSSCNGSGVFGPEFKRCSEAKRHAEVIAARHPSLGPFEIERIEYVGLGSSRRYWMRQRRRWVPWRWDVEIETRQPDWRYT